MGDIVLRDVLKSGSIYLAGPMTGYVDYNYPTFLNVAEAIREAGFGVTCPAEFHNGDTSKPYSFYLRHALAQMLNCGSVVALDEWHSSNGARLEVNTANAVDIPVFGYPIIAQALGLDPTLSTPMPRKD